MGKTKIWNVSYLAVVGANSCYPPKLLIRFITKLFFHLFIKITRKTATTWDDRIVITLARPVGYFVGISFWFLFLYATGLEGKLYNFLILF